MPDRLRALARRKADFHQLHGSSLKPNSPPTSLSIARSIPNAPSAVNHRSEFIGGQAAPVRCHSVLKLAVALLDGSQIEDGLILITNEFDEISENPPPLTSLIQTVEELGAGFEWQVSGPEQKPRLFSNQPGLSLIVASTLDSS